MLLAAPAERLAERRVVEDVQRARRALLDGVDEVAGLAVLDLQRDPADVAADERPRPSRAPRDTVSPKPSRVDFWITTSASDWKALTSIAPTLLKLLRMWMSGSPSAWAIVEL